MFWIMPQRRPITMFEELVRTGTNGLVVASVGTLMLALVTVWWTLIHQDKKGGLAEAVICVIRLSLSQGFPIVPGSKKMKMLLLFCFGAFVPLCVLVQGFITSTLTEPFLEPKIENIHDLIDSDLSMQYLWSFEDWLFGKLNEKDRERIKRKYIPLIKYTPELLTGTKRRAVVIFKSGLTVLKNPLETERLAEVRFCSLSKCRVEGYMVAIVQCVLMPTFFFFSIYRY